MQSLTYLLISSVLLLEIECLSNITKNTKKEVGVDSLKNILFYENQEYEMPINKYLRNTTKKYVASEGLLDKLKDSTSDDDVIPRYTFTVPFIYRNKYPAAPLCTGIILTESRILCTAYPIAFMPQSWYCALPGYSDLSKVSLHIIQTNCLLIKTTIVQENWNPRNSSSTELAIVHLQKCIDFIWTISTAPIIYEAFPIHKSNAISVVWKYRMAITGPGFPFHKTAVEMITLRGYVIKMHENNISYVFMMNEVVDICLPSVGTPVMCDCVVVGLIYIPQYPGPHDYFTCARVGALHFVYLMNTQAKKFIEKWISHEVD